MGRRKRRSTRKFERVLDQAPARPARRPRRRIYRIRVDWRGPDNVWRRLGEWQGEVDSLAAAEARALESQRGAAEAVGALGLKPKFLMSCPTGRRGP